MNRARHRIFDDAGDEGFLWDLRLPLISHRVDEVAEMQPGQSVDELRSELERLLREGHVEIYEPGDAFGTVLREDEAVAVISDDRNWYSPDALDEEDEPRSAIYCLVLTKSGREQFIAELAASAGDA
jgi:hypothetical protein